MGVTTDPPGPGEPMTGWFFLKDKCCKVICSHTMRLSGLSKRCYTGRNCQTEKNKTPHHHKSPTGHYFHIKLQDRRFLQKKKSLCASYCSAISNSLTALSGWWRLQRKCHRSRERWDVGLRRCHTILPPARAHQEKTQTWHQANKWPPLLCFSLNGNHLWASKLGHSMSKRSVKFIFGLTLRGRCYSPPQTTFHFITCVAQHLYRLKVIIFGPYHCSVGLFGAGAPG